ncbi:hypothetical protein DFR65_102333 [Oceanihabitans sediminis]|uniref:Uncharacterized protein n=1 Tax=Oceanihabitans sediminis TaxID=1812012 RepID=A0A368P4X3_9FLAO|nr:hypothetical protein [Oceanihabitans sediminis]RBP32997.1 hypothetical protein DFR65_102333 [Oceanihabitans sediminis]RCU57486.1 hypothetical protein DU428_06735 [Oceanihabitans sediminis]
MNITNKELNKVGEEIKIVVKDLQTRAELSKSVISAYTDFETEFENGKLHNVSSKLENVFNVYLNEDPNAEAKIISKIETYLSGLPLPKGMDSDKANKFKKDLAKIGLETLRVELKVFNINQETKALKKHNQLNIDQLAEKILNYAEDLKRNIELNKANHKEVNEALSDNSLDGLSKAAKLINPNAKNYNDSLEQEIDDFLNGGDLIL